MNVKKFTAPTSREALRKVREALGPDAVILSNRPVDGVVEILALDNDDVASLASPSPESEMAAPRPQLHHMDDGLAQPAAAPAPRPYDAPAARRLPGRRAGSTGRAPQRPDGAPGHARRSRTWTSRRPLPTPTPTAARRSRKRHPVSRRPSTWPR